MDIAVTGATGFIGRYLVERLTAAGHCLRLLHRATSDRGGFEPFSQEIAWVEGTLGETATAERLVDGCEAVVHAALDHAPGVFRQPRGELSTYLERNLMGSLRLIEAARQSGVRRFVLLSTCAVHERILADRPLDEAHPTWSTHHYGAHKAALEQFVHSYGWGDGWEICALRPTGVYGVARPVERSKWFDLVAAVVRGERVACHGGGKEVHVGDVARAVDLLLSADNVAGEVYNCYDRYVSQLEVAEIAKRVAKSSARIIGEPSQPKHQISTAKLQALGMQFGGEPLLEETVSRLVNAVVHPS